MSTPLMKQYQQVKAKYPDTILLFRMGDFFETFDEDAKITSKVLGIVLTKRGNGASGETPLAGFPHHALDAYLPKLLRAGYRVAICEQMEDPKFAKGIVKRDVVEVMSPGVAFSDKVLEEKQNNYLAAIALPSPLATSEDRIGFAFIDVSTGEFGLSEFPLKQLFEQANNLQPQELLVQKRDLETIKTLLGERFRVLYTKVDDWVYNADYAYELLVNHFKTQSLKGFGIEEMRIGTIAAGAVMNYLQETQKTNILHIKKIVPHDVSEYMLLDISTKRNLEITTNISGQPEGTLYAIIDRTCTPMGGRMLKQWINRPLKRLEPIQARLTAVQEMVTNESTRSRIREELDHIGDLERLIAKIATGRANPREVNQLKAMLELIPNLKSQISNLKNQTLVVLNNNLDSLADLVSAIDKAIADDPPIALVDGGVIQNGYNAELDEIRALAYGAKDWVAKHQQSERERTGISSLKISFNNVFGYFIEVTNTHRDKVPDNYIRKQTLTNAERFVTPELKEYEEKILHAEEKILALETRLFNELRKMITEHAETIQTNAYAIATLDCFVSLADVAVENKYTCPIVDDSLCITIQEGRHPVIEKLLPPGEHYTPNNTLLDTASDQILIITGPNMSGKSSYLRQVGLNVLLAQIGSFVPAASARIGIVDRIYTRVGASDNIASGESTFLVEMHEAANIVNTATERSLILLDEIGRGTSTFDGISIAWALTEYLHERIGAKTLFATHYHELNELADLFTRIKNYKVDVREYGDKVIFLHKVMPGFADHSYGIQVAQMAGLPEEVTERAKQVLKNLESSELVVRTREKKEMKYAKSNGEVQLAMFEVKDDKLREELVNLDIEHMTPLEALQILAILKSKIETKD
ncbi:MAG: DNA mismatch repair protein MutS [Ignavibacteriales bacterium]|nr:DNA mismatch repair protein MutS [Ignavibacteriales bacterium]